MQATTDGKSSAGIMTAAVSSVLSEVQGNNLAHMRPLGPDGCTCVVMALSRNSRRTSFIYAQLVK